MDALDIILMPFVFIYRIVSHIILSPYYFIKGLSNSVNKDSKKLKNINTNEEIIIKKGVRSAYDEPHVNKKVLTAEEELSLKKETAQKKQEEFNKIFNKNEPKESISEMKKGKKVIVINNDSQMPSNNNSNNGTKQTETVNNTTNQLVTDKASLDNGVNQVTPNTQSVNNNAKQVVQNAQPVNNNVKQVAQNAASQKQVKKVSNDKEFERYVQKARFEEQRRVKDQERRIKEQQQKEALKLKKEEEKAKREAIALKKSEEKKKNKSSKANGIGSMSIQDLWQKITYNKQKEMEFKAKKQVLNEQFQNQGKTDSRFSNTLRFEYIARNPDGKLEKSIIEALSRVDVYSFLIQEGYEVYDVTLAKASTIEIGSFKFKINKLVFYLSQLSAYLKSGIALADAFKILENQSKNRNEKKVLRAVYYDLTMGDNLSVALAKRKTAFPKLLINMIKTAEMTGDLIETLDDMVDYYTESEQTRKQMISALIYPTFVLAFALIVVVFLLWKVVPTFEDMYKDTGSELPFPTKLVLSLSKFTQNNIYKILFGVIAFCIIFIVLYKNVKSFKKAMQVFAMHVPVFGNIIIFNEVTVFTKTFSNLLNHNVFITDSIDVLSKITENEVYKELIYETATNLTKGETISTAFKNHWAFPDIAYQMLITGEKTGRLGPMMEKVSVYYEEQHRNIINRMKSLIEPILIVSLALIVGFILLSVILPMYGSYDNISKM